MPDKHDWLIIRGGHAFRLGSGISEERQREMLVTLCKFLNDNCLVVVELPVEEEHDWDSFELRSSHLSERGLLLIKSAFPRWLSAIDRGTAPAKSTILKRALEKLGG